VGYSPDARPISLQYVCSVSDGLWHGGYWLEYRTRNFQVGGSILTAGHLQSTLSKLLTYGVFRSTQPPILSETGNEY